MKEQMHLSYCNRELIRNDLPNTKEDLFIYLKDKITENQALIEKYKNVKFNIKIINQAKLIKIIGFLESSYN